MVQQLKNWASNYAYSTTNIHHPESVEQIQTLVKQFQKVRALGTRHSFNKIADSTENLIMLDQYKPDIHIDSQRKTVTIGGGVTYGELSKMLHAEGYALHNLASLPHISVVGACATATHGSGTRNTNLASVVNSMDIVTADGSLVTLSREHDGDVFKGAVVHLGGLGVVATLTLDLLPTFEISQHVYENLPLAQVDAHFDEIMSSHYSVSLFTDWQGESINQVWLKHRIGNSTSIPPQTEFFGATAATKAMHPIPGISGEPCTQQFGVAGPWHERLPHFRIEATPSAGDELQTEYFVARADAVAALQAVRTLRHEVAPHLLISEIRCIAADDFWMSPCYRQDSVGIHFTWKPDWASVQKVLPRIEAQLAPFHARPHWGKLFTMPPQQIQSQYEMLPKFKQLLGQYDPQGKFRNAFLDTILFGD